MTLDISKMQYNDWLDFTFNHEVNLEDPWHFHDKWKYEIDGEVLIKNLTHLFNTSKELIGRYSYEQIDQGFWFIPGPNGYMWVVLDSKIDLKERILCIDSIQYLFLNIYSKYDIGTSGYMWWDSLVSYCVFDKKNLSNDLEITESIVSVLIKIYNQGYESSVESALQGMEHIIKMSNYENNPQLEQIINKSKLKEITAGQ